MRLQIYPKKVKITDLVVAILINVSYECYCIFRPDGNEQIVQIKNGEFDKTGLYPIEKEYFEIGYYKNLTELN